MALTERRRAAGPAYTEQHDFDDLVRRPDVDTAVNMDAYAQRNVTRNTIQEAEQRLNEYRAERASLTERIIENEQYFEFTATSGRPRLRKRCGRFTKSQSAYLFNSIANKHADFMDNMPSPAILPQEESDEETARLLSKVVPVIFDKCGFEETYSANSYTKMIEGTGVYCVLWDGAEQNGIGEIKIKKAELMNLYWKGGVQDLEDSPEIFYISIMNNRDLTAQYPQLKDKVGSGTVLNLSEFVYEDMPRRDKMTLVIDWYYKKPELMQNEAGVPVLKYFLHYCKFSCGEVLYASEDDLDEEGKPRYPFGFYEHGEFPYKLDIMFPLKGSPAGFGEVDIMKNPQQFIDDLDTALAKNSKLKAAPKVLAPVGSGIKAKDMLDPEKPVVNYSGMRDQVLPVQMPDLPSDVVNYRNLKVDELKETSGNRDFSQGSTTSGVTAASAIAALQEAGSKLSRDMIKQSYFVYARLAKLVIELIRQFYETDRVYRVAMDNEGYQYVHVSNALLKRPEDKAKDNFGTASGDRQLYFDIRVSAQKASPFSRAAQNELAKELYGAGFFNPQFADQVLLALSMMDFDGKDEIVTKIQNNARLAAENDQLKNQVIQLAGMLASTGDERSRMLAAEIAQRYSGQQQVGAVMAPSMNTGGTGGGINGRVERAAEQTRERTEVR